MAKPKSIMPKGELVTMVGEDAAFRENKAAETATTIIIADDNCELELEDFEDRTIICRVRGRRPNMEVNNAGVNFNTGLSNSVDYAQTVIETNYYGTKRMTESMLPLMKSCARILNVGSRLGRINGRRNKIGDQMLRTQLEDEDQLTEELIDNTVERFLGQVKEGTWVSSGWPQIFTDYSVSKLAVNSYTRLLSRRFSDRPAGSKIYVNCYCPGWVKTDMTGREGNITADEGADTGVWTVLLPPKSPTGKFFAERREISY